VGFTIVGAKYLIHKAGKGYFCTVPFACFFISDTGRLSMSLFTGFGCLTILTFVAFGNLGAAEAPKDAPRVPMKEDFENSLRAVWLKKKVHESRVIHDMEDLSGWSATGIGQVELTKDRSIDGSTSLRFRTSLRDEDLIQQNPGGRMMGSAAAVLSFPEPQDWSNYNRIALWVYVHPSDIRVHTFYLRFTCQDATSSITDPHYASVIQGLTPGQWNYALWEIPNLRRDKVTEFSIVKLTTGYDPKESGYVTYDFDRLELQRVDAEKYEGWEVAPGKIAYSHVGYKPEQPKVALASGLSASQFQLRDARTGNVVLTKPVRSVKNNRGEFQLLDFSEVREPGEYVIWAGDRTSRPFVISDTLWLDPIRKALNFYYSQRCGFDVPGVHPECHKDVQGIHDGKKKIINGGWHDAGDLSQGSFRTGMSVYSMLQLIEQLDRRSMDQALQERILEEALWGLDWLLKTRFGDGYRITWNGLGIYTDGIIGTIDDVVKPAQNNPWENFIASGVEVLAYITLKERKPELAKQCLRAAEEDWQAAVKLQPQWLDSGKVVLTGDGIIDNREPFSHRWFSGGTYLTLSWGIVSSIHLYEATGRSDYAERAMDYGRLLMRCQEREFLAGIPLTGFFYTSPEKLAIVNHRHAAFEESPLLAFMALCRAFPDHEDWMNWYAAATLHSEYFLKRGAQFSAPYDVLPNAVFRKADILSVPNPEVQEAMLRQFQEGTRLTDEYHLRIFPIWTTRTHHGNTAVQLSQTLALVAASQIRSNLSLENLAAMQLQWVFGGNPFSQSLMYGEGYDYPPLYAYNPGDIVGSLPVGMDCVRNDEPFWSASNHSTFKEIWVVPVNRFLWNAVYLAMPASVQGEVRGAETDTIAFCDQATSTCRNVKADRSGKFQTQLPAGHYEIRLGSASWNVTLVSGGNYQLTLNPEQNVDFRVGVKSQDVERKIVRVQATAEGNGPHDFSIRVFNGTVSERKKPVNLKTGQKVEIAWDIAVTDPKVPWVAVILPDGDLTWKQELTGTLEGL
jgi:hypothetical protein